MTDFSRLEQRVKEACAQHGANKSHDMKRSIGKSLGFNPDSTWWAPDEFINAIKPLEVYMKKRFAGVEFNRVWRDAEAAALAILKEQGNKP